MKSIYTNNLLYKYTYNLLCIYTTTILSEYLYNLLYVYTIIQLVAYTYSQIDGIQYGSELACVGA